MTTGYTYALENQAKPPSFETFVWTCAQAFDIWCRDNDGHPPLNRKPDTKYSSERLRKAKKELAALEGMTDAYLQLKIDADHKKELRYWEKEQKKSAEINRRYKDMRTQVAAWVPPSAEHEHLKVFMLQQIDLHSEYTSPKPKRKTASAYRKETRVSLRKDIAYHERKIQEATKRAAEFNDYWGKLNASVPRPEDTRSKVRDD